MLTLTQNPKDFQIVFGVNEEAKGLPDGILLA
jgi:hypothetical protein